MQARIDRQRSNGSSVSAGSRPGSRASPSPNPVGSHDPGLAAAAHDAAAHARAEAVYTARHAAQGRLAGTGDLALQSAAGSGMDAAGLRVTLKLKPDAKRTCEPHPLARCLTAVERALAHPDAEPFAQPVCGPVLRIRATCSI